MGLYFGDSIFLTYSSHTFGKTGLTLNAHWATQDTGDTFGWGSNKISFKTLGFGAGYAYDDLMDNLSIVGNAGYGLSNIQIDNSNLSSIDYNTGLYYMVGANYQILPAFPLTLGAKLVTVPTFDWTTSTGAKTYGGTSVIFGAAFTF